MADPQVKAIMLELEGFTDRVVRALALEVIADVVEDTPIDTGWARANWVPFIGPVTAAPSVPTREAKVLAVPGAKAAQASAIDRVLQSYTAKQGPVTVANSVDYIFRLNEGSSSQAPSGFVQAAFERAIRRVQARNIR